MAQTKKSTKPKSKAPEISPEDKAKEDLQRELNKLVSNNKKQYLNPARTFKVGDEVEHVTAFWNDCTVLDVFENIFYLVEIHYTESNYGKNTPAVRQRWIPWLELRLKNKESRAELFNERKNNINNCFSFSNRELSDLISKRYHFGVNDTPDYQRDLVWSLDDKQSLIDSIFKGVDIGKFVFISLDYKPDSPCYEILDGKQRLNAIVEFHQDRFEFKGYKFSDLHLEDRRYFERYLITIGESRGELTDKQKYEYFLRLNTRGREQSKEHLEKVQDLLRNSNENQN